MNKLMTVVLLSAVVTVHAGLVPNGDFAMYKPGTGYTVRATFPENVSWYVTTLGDNVAVQGHGDPEAIYADGTSGNAIDVPGWITPVESQGSPTMPGHLFSSGYDPDDGTSCFNAYGYWSGQKGNLAMSDSPLIIPVLGEGEFYKLSAMVAGNVRPITFDLLVDGVVLEPTLATEPEVSYDWCEISRTYTSIPSGDVRVLLGTARPGDGDPMLDGTRLRMDDVSLSVVPEPSSLVLLGLGGLLLQRKRK